MKEAEGNEAEHRGRRWKWPIVLFPVLVMAAIATVFFFRGQGVGEQLRAMAAEGAAAYQEEVRGPGWYVKLAEKYKLPAMRRPVRFSSRTVTDEDMAVVGRADTLLAVDLYGSKISDAGMAHLAGLTKLQTLLLTNTKIGDAGLAHLAGLTKMQSLFLTNTKIGDEGLVHLKKLKNLRWLNLSGTEVTDEGLALLCGFGNLEHLDLGSTRVTDASLAHLKSL
ncbi:MAG TPA: hypothetical protein VJJ98_14455, partial [Sedimentisphaerales bacterium]|nr:hypothetical protein [Sedimentisphaerales bacterium]